MPDGQDEKTNEQKYTWDVGDVAFEPGSGSDKPLVPDNMKEEAKRRMRQEEAGKPGTASDDEDLDKAPVDR